MDRRRFIRNTGIAALAGGIVGNRVFANVENGKKPNGKAKSVIQIWLWGGPPHIDTFDPKPDAGPEICGPLKGVSKTNVDGIVISPLLPELAKIADKYSLIRGMTHGENGHETASYVVQTGRWPGRYVYPCVGAVSAKFLGYDAGYKGILPPYIILTRPIGRFSEAGFLGVKYKPFATGGDPAGTPFAVEGIVATGMTESRQKSRQELLEELNTFKHAIGSNETLSRASNAKDQAYDLILGSAGKVFDLSKEDPKIRDMYGRSSFGQSCLVARKLVEVGVPYVSINFPGWDLHKSAFQILNTKGIQLDKGLSALINDLSRIGLLDSTIVFCGGEFGRTPKVDIEAPYFGGRGHYGKAFSYLIAGGGFKGGNVVGKTDKKGAEVIERPVSPADLIGSIYSQLGIDNKTTLMTPQGEVVSLISNEGMPKTDGILKEIM